MRSTLPSLRYQRCGNTPGKDSVVTHDLGQEGTNSEAGKPCYRFFSKAQVYARMKFRFQSEYIRMDEQGEEIGLVVDCEWPEALSDNLEDKAAAKGALIFSLDGTSCYILVPVLVSQEFVLHLDPIYFGDYPKSMRERLGDRPPKFSQQERELLKDSLDFIGLNHYTSKFVGHATNSLEENDFYKIQDVEIIAEWGGGEVIGQKAASSWLYMVPWGIRKVLNHIAERYGNPPVYITENGMDDEDEDTSPLHEMLDDKLRVSYFKAYLASIHQAILWAKETFLCSRRRDQPVSPYVRPLPEKEVDPSSLNPEFAFGRRRLPSSIRGNTPLPELSVEAGGNVPPSVTLSPLALSAVQAVGTTLPQHYLRSSLSVVLSEAIVISGTI
ncbi:Beta-glucosidase 4 [Capsicum chinense]|nr:Beta-glucosidase 4 [Capsicum chinense]